MSSLAHKTVVIMGGTSGIGPADREGRTGRRDRQNGEQQPRDSVPMISAARVGPAAHGAILLERRAGNLRATVWR